MEEKNTTNPSVKNESKKPNKKGKLAQSFTDHKAEFKKIIWPNRKDVAKKTGTVIVTSLLFGVIIFCMDTIYSAGYNAIFTLLG